MSTLKLTNAGSLLSDKALKRYRSKLILHHTTLPATHPNNLLPTLGRIHAGPLRGPKSHGSHAASVSSQHAPRLLPIPPRQPHHKRAGNCHVDLQPNGLPLPRPPPLQPITKHKNRVQLHLFIAVLFSAMWPPALHGAFKRGLEADMR